MKILCYNIIVIIMGSLYDLLNIKNINVEEEIKKTILETKIELNNLTTIRTCKIYSSKVSELLKQKHIVNRIVDTKTKDMNYSHQFVIVPKDNNYSYIIDLTLNQFVYNSLYDDMYQNGYMLLNNEEFNSYLDYIEFNNFNLDSYIEKANKL